MNVNALALEALCPLSPPPPSTATNVSPPIVDLPLSSTVISIDNIPSLHKQIIIAAMADIFGILTPRNFQIEAINHCVFDDDAVLFIVQPTANGKSLVPLTIATIRRGVTIVLVPLIGLGSDQVEKATVLDHNVEAYHIDEHKQLDARAVRDRLNHLSVSEANSTTILLFMSPQSLKRDPKRPNAGWYGVIASLARRGLVSLFCIDEAHTVQQCGRNFRPEFVGATKIYARYDNQ